MTRYTPLWQQAGTYPAAVDRGLLGTLWPSSGSTGGAPSLVANTMNVSIAAGTAAVAMTTGGALTELCRWDAPEVVTLTAAPTANSRIDLVVLQVRDNALDGGGNNDFLFQAITGTVAASPTVPAVPANAYPICQVPVAANIPNLNGVTLTDRRVSTLQARDLYHARVGRNAALATTTAGAFVPWDAVIHDPMGLWVAAQTGFVLPAPGTYLVNAKMCGYPGNTSEVQLSIYRNGSGLSVASQPNVASYGIHSRITDTVFAAAGDLIQLQLMTPAAAGTILNGVTQNYMSVDYLGTG